MTQKCAESIRVKLAEYLKDQMFVYPIRDLRKILKSKKAEERAAIKEKDSKDPSQNILLYFDFTQMLFESTSDDDCDESSKDHAEENMDYKTTNTLLNVYPDILSDLDLLEENVFDDDNTGHSDTPEKLNKTLKILRLALKSIALPEYYYGYKLVDKKADIYSQQKKLVRKASDKLISVKSASGNDKSLRYLRFVKRKGEGKKSQKLKNEIAAIWGILDYLNTMDLTEIGLICSNAVTINPEQIKIPFLFSLCRKKVMKQLERYRNSEKYYDAFHLELPRKALKKTKTYIKPITDQYVYSLTEASAIEFIKKCVVPNDLTSETIKKTLYSIYKPIMDKDPAYQFFTEFHFLYLCIQTKKRALQLIANNAIATLITLSLD